MHAQTPVQIAWVTTESHATEKALTSLLGAKKWVRVPGVHFSPDTCTYRGRPADFVANISISYAGDTQLELIAPVRARASTPSSSIGRALDCTTSVWRSTTSTRSRRLRLEVVQRGDAGRHEFAYVTAQAAGVPYIEIAPSPPETRAFFDYVKQEQR